jgi:hypothetical protein
MEKTGFKMEGDITIITEVEEYLEKRLLSY